MQSHTLHAPARAAGGEAVKVYVGRIDGRTVAAMAAGYDTELEEAAEVRKWLIAGYTVTMEDGPVAVPFAPPEAK